MRKRVMICAAIGQFDFEPRVSRHNPYHYPHSCLARRLSNLGPQQRLGVWAFWNCRPHSHRGHHLGSAGSAVISFSEAQLSAAGFQAYRAEG